MNRTGQEPDHHATRFITPAPYGYIYLGMRIAPPRRAPFVRADSERRTVLDSCKRRARQLAALDEVVAATVYEAVLIPPVSGSPRFDITVLIQTTSPEAIPTVESTEAYRRMNPDFAMTARNIRRIGDTDRNRAGYFLFNHFTASEPANALDTWEDVTRWFIGKAHVDNSALLEPTRESPYVFVNHVRLPTGPIRFMLNFAKPSFTGSVAARLKAAHIGNAPIICKAH